MSERLAAPFMRAAGGPRRAFVTALATFALAPGGTRAQPRPPTMAVVRPGAGFLAGSPHTEIPLMIVLASSTSPSVASARVTAAEGRVRGTTVVDRSRVLFFYRPKPGRSAEILDVALMLETGDTVAEAFALEVRQPSQLDLKVDVRPEVVAARATAPVTVAATSSAPQLATMRVFSDGRALRMRQTDGPGATLRGDLELPAVPQDAPSFVQVVAVATSAAGYRIVASGVSVRAPIRLSVQLPRGHALAVEGAVNRPAPVPAAVTGRTVMEDVEVVYGQRLRAYSVRGRRRRPLSVVIPTGRARPLVIALPEQTVADGGAGPTLAVVVPPSPIGGRPFWPDIRVEGARLLDVVPHGPRVRALILRRPTRPGTVRVRLDDEIAGAFELSAGRAQRLRIASTPADPEERAAVVIEAYDAAGNPTDDPPPRARLAGPAAVDLALRRLGPGRYRGALPRSTPGAPGAAVELIAEVPPAPTIAGAAPAAVRRSAQVVLSGPSPAPTAEPLDRAPRVDAAGAAPHPPAGRWGLAACALIGGTTAPLLSVGGQVVAEARLPWLHGRFLVRAGVELERAAGDGELRIEAGRFGATTTVTSLRFPLEVGVVLVRAAPFELAVRAGAAVRRDQVTLDVDGDLVGSGAVTSVAGRVGLDAGSRLGPGDLVLGFTLLGLGASVDGIAGDPAQLSGDLVGFRGELGYRIWF